jgi:regulatory protein
MRFCAYQERTQQEVRERLAEWGVYGEDAEVMIVQLIEDNFINEERFAKVYAGGKFRLKKWGRIKIEHALRQKGLSDYCVEKGLAEITTKEYQQTLRKLLEKKWNSLMEDSAFQRKAKTAQYAIGKGYESELIWEILKGF